jgi:hypothetical protein
MQSPALAVGFALVVAQLAVAAQSRMARQSDGHPDLTGYWTNDSFTPLERSSELGNKEFFSPEEAAAYFKQRLNRLNGQAKDDIHYDDALWQAETYEKQPNLRTSIVFDPPDGRLPPLTPEAQRRDTDRREAAGRRGSADSAQSRTLGERCIAWGNVGPPMLPPTYNANFQILETPEAVILRHEMVHDTRIIYRDGRPHVGAGVRLLAGDSRATWEGDTLVIDTTNFTNETNFRGSPQTTRQDIFASDALHVLERLTPLDADTIRYRFTVEDPQTWTRSWSGESTFHRWQGPIYEYACHEGNYGLANILRAARAAELPRPDPAAR